LALIEICFEDGAVVQYTAKEYFTIWNVHPGKESCHEHNQTATDNAAYIVIADCSIDGSAYKDYIDDYKRLYDLIPEDKFHKLEIQKDNTEDEGKNYHWWYIRLKMEEVKLIKVNETVQYEKEE